MLISLEDVRASLFQSYELRDWDGDNPSLAIKSDYPLPDGGGHDLQPVPSSNDLVVTTGLHVYFFDRDKHEFRLHPDLGDRTNVKSVSVHPATGQTAFIQATESWWSDTLDLLSPAGAMRLPGGAVVQSEVADPSRGEVGIIRGEHYGKTVENHSANFGRLRCV